MHTPAAIRLPLPILRGARRPAIPVRDFRGLLDTSRQRRKWSRSVGWGMGACAVRPAGAVRDRPRGIRGDNSIIVKMSAYNGVRYPPADVAPGGRRACAREAHMRRFTLRDPPAVVG